MEKNNLGQVQDFLESLLKPIIKGVMEESFKSIINDIPTTINTSFEPPPDRYIDIKELKELFKVSEVTIWDWEKKGLLKAYRIGRLKRYKLNEILESPKAIERGFKN